MIRFRSYQITFLILPLELILSLLKYVLVPAIFLLLALRILKIPDYLEKEYSISSGIWEIGLIITAALLLYLPKTIMTINTSFLWIKRKLVLLCEGGYPQFRRKNSHPLCIISKYRFPYPTFHHKSQIEIERNILSSLKNNKKDSKSLLYFISGESGTGKSTLAFFICHSILVERVYRYMDSIYYYDFGRSRVCQNRFIIDSRALRHEDAVVIIDNFHDIYPDNLKRITEYILNISNKKIPGCIVILSQPLEKVGVIPGHDIRLLTEIKRKYSFFDLKQIDINSSSIPMDNNIWYTLRERKIIDPELPNYSLVCLHINRLLSSVKGCKVRQEHMVFWECLKPGMLSGSDLKISNFLNLLGVICALSIHRGGFTTHEFRMVCQVNSVNFVMERTTNWVKSKILLWRLVKSGFLGTRSLQGKRYIFHDALAQHYKDVFFSEPGFRKNFISAIEKLYFHNIESQAHQLLCWLYASEIGKDVWLDKLFDQAMIKGNFNRMLKTLRRNESLFDGKLIWDHQMGILLEKVGYFIESCRHLSKVISNSPIGKEERSRAIFALIEAEHGQDALASLVRLESSPGRLNSLAAKYWIEHIKCHFGEFNWEKLVELADSYAKHLSATPALRKSYFAIHLARRIYFDLFRFYYLLGYNDFKTLTKVRDHELGKFLKTNHVEFDAFILKFYNAHYIHYFVLFELGIFKDIQDYYDDTIIPKSYFKDIHISKFADLAISFYKQSIDAFEVFGDKTTQYIKPRIVELELLQERPNMDDALIQLNAFAKFINETEFRDMKAYPHLYLFKFNYLRSFQVLQAMEKHDCNESASKVLGDSDYYRKIARNELEIAIRIHRYENNCYGLFKGTLLMSIIDLVDSQDYNMFRETLQKLLDQSLAFRYYREQRIIEMCLQKERVGLREMIDIIKYYPVILQ